MKMKFILGAGDPEMEMIENILKEHKLYYEYAKKNGIRCHSGNAYQADNTVILDEYAMWHIFIECRYDDMLSVPMHTMIDHHKTGDPGYGKPPYKYWEASSLGQVVKFLNAQKIIVTRTDEMYLCAAADHCLLAAYHGECNNEDQNDPIIDPEEIMRWRIATRAKFQNRSEVAILADVENARKILMEKKGAHYADLRGVHIPELPEASAREGIPFISSIEDRDGRIKIVMQSAPEWLIEKFMKGEIIPDMKDIYGDPMRGFAGGYI